MAHTMISISMSPDTLKQLDDWIDNLSKNPNTPGLKISRSKAVDILIRKALNDLKDK